MVGAVIDRQNGRKYTLSVLRATSTVGIPGEQGSLG